MKKYISLAMLAVSLVGLSSCLKDKNLVLDGEKSPAVVEFSTIYDVPTGHAGLYTSYVRSFDISPAGGTSSFEVGLTGADAASGDINVEIDLNTQAIADYNTENGSSLVLLPASLYTLDQTAVIKSGTRKAVLNATFKTASFDLSKSYVLPMRIKSAGSANVSKNYGTVLYVIGAKNQYDGTYSYKGRIVRDADMALGGPTKAGLTVKLTTQAADRVGFVPLWADGSNIGGIDGTSITVNPTTNKVTLKSTVNATLVNNPPYDNRYDPATKTFYVSAYWGGGPASRAFTDTMTYIGPR